jgi:hypothetical protein
MALTYLPVIIFPVVLCGCEPWTLTLRENFLNFFLIRIAGGGVHTESTWHVGHFWPIVPAPGDCEDAEFGGMKIGRGNRSTRRKPAPPPVFSITNPNRPLREEHRLRVFQNRVLRRIFGLKKDEVTGGWRKLHEELHKLYSSPSIIKMIKSKRMRWTGHVARIGEKRNAYRILVGNAEGRTLSRRWTDNIKMEFSLLQIVQTGSGVHPNSYPMGTGGSIPGVRRPGREVDHSPPTSAEVKKNMDIYMHSPIRLHGVVLN